MQRFYPTLSELHSFTLSANSLLFNQPCPHCQCTDQWVSHGFSYSQSGEVRGKRLVCCARFKKRGCGRTIALYLSHTWPQRRYLLTTLAHFIQLLVQGSTVEHAYHLALGHQHHSHRQAYRWLDTLYKKLGEFRTQLHAQHQNIHPAEQRAGRLANLLSTLRRIGRVWPDITQYQQQFNQRFC